MKKIFRSLLATALLATATVATQAQPTAPVAAAFDTTRIVLDPSLINPVSLQSYEAFRAAVKPLVAQMATKKIVALGEGTHGTSEFYTLRFWLTRILMEEHGFKQVALENDYTDSYLLDEALRQPNAAVAPLMKAHLYSIWQNQEMAELLTWLQTHNRTHRKQFHLRGFDAVSAVPDAQQLSALATRYPAAKLTDLTSKLETAAVVQDSVWHNLNKKGYKFNRKRWLSNGLSAYYTVEKLQQALRTAKLPRRQRELAQGFALDAKLNFSVFYEYEVNKKDAPRDSLMAQMTKFLVRGKNDKVILWAHDAHLARKSTDPTDNNGGGAGSYIERMFPGQYFVLGTSTATGTFAATTDRLITYDSPMASYPLEKPLAGSWEASLSAVKVPVFYLQTQQLGVQNLERPLRFVGYRPDSGKDSYSNYQLTEAYDALLFVRQTKAATPLK
ncbi:erythromycin esterase family protein [Hymenobacter tibetensis]|uniref:Erythromycin esterase family protein n=1 Tax=Hymenobacter tibetensis TaxID=497967 RepID=A0ABY4CZM6_9BACT|nr:erythromycin esterase family protein [Hymenobacter tibetensis]UOG74625.1 erythromycin esterase family protein [Hymenobacter tibetensis]